MSDPKKQAAIGIIYPGTATDKEVDNARAIAHSETAQKWKILTNTLTAGVFPGPYAMLATLSATVKSSDIAIICCDRLWSSPQMMIEILFALSFQKPLIILSAFEFDGFHKNEILEFLRKFPKDMRHEKQVVVTSPQQAINQVIAWL